MSVREVLVVALLRDLFGLSGSEISTRVPMEESSAKRRYQIHRAWMGSMRDYWKVVGAAAVPAGFAPTPYPPAR